MRLLSWKKQNEIYKRLVAITVELMRQDETGLKDAVVDVYNIANIVGGKQMVEQMEGAKK